MKNNNTMQNIALPGILVIAALTGNVTAASQSWNKSGGDPAKAYYSIGSSVAASATSAAASAQGNAYADVAILGSGCRRLAYAAASVSGTKTSLAANGRVEFLGGTIWSASKSGSLTSYIASLPHLSKSWKPPVSPVFVVGGIPVKVTPSVSVGIDGSVSGNVNTATQTFTGSLAPVNLDCGAGVTASVAAGLVRANGSLTVFRVSPNLTSTCSWKSRTASSKASLAYGTLGGSIDIEAGKSWFQYKLNLMKWPGYSGNLTLFNESVKF